MWNLRSSTINASVFGQVRVVGEGKGEEMEGQECPQLYPGQGFVKPVPTVANHWSGAYGNKEMSQSKNHFPQDAKPHSCPSVSIGHSWAGQAGLWDDLITSWGQTPSEFQMSFLAATRLCLESKDSEGTSVMIFGWSTRVTVQTMLLLTGGSVLAFCLLLL